VTTGTSDRGRVLIVEDDPATQQLLAALLKRDGFDSAIAGDGRQAIDALRRDAYSVIILDLMMPAVGGKEVIDFLSDEKRSDKIIVCTAAGPQMTGEINSDLVKAVVRKPFDIDTLMAAVTSVSSGD
jgi:DNA-binding response OmpR family regulator